LDFQKRKFDGLCKQIKCGRYSQKIQKILKKFQKIAENSKNKNVVQKIPTNSGKFK
jgi:hypothetical protein